MEPRVVATVAVWTDGLGSFQARCCECDWKSLWFERGAESAREQLAIEAAHKHGLLHSERNKQ